MSVPKHVTATSFDASGPWPRPTSPLCFLPDDNPAALAGPRTNDLDEEELHRVVQQIVLAQAWFPAAEAAAEASEVNFALAFQGNPLTERAPTTLSILSSLGKVHQAAFAIHAPGGGGEMKRDTAGLWNGSLVLRLPLGPVPEGDAAMPNMQPGMCVLEVEGCQAHSEVLGEAYCFDSTFSHRLVNNTGARQLSLVLSFAIRESDLDAITAFASQGPGVHASSSPGDELGQGDEPGQGDVQLGLEGPLNGEQGDKEVARLALEAAGMSLVSVEPNRGCEEEGEEKIYVYPEVPDKYKGAGLLRDDGTPG